MDWKLELVVVPVADQDRAKAFYTEKVGFGLDVDHRAGDFRVVQLTPPGAACSITLMRNPEAAGSVQGLHLVVSDIEAAHAVLVAGGVAVTELFHFQDGQQLAGHDPEPPRLQHFLLLHRPGRHRLDGPGGQARRVGVAVDDHRADSPGSLHSGLWVTRPGLVSPTAGSLGCSDSNPPLAAGR